MLGLHGNSVPSVKVFKNAQERNAAVKRPSNFLRSHLSTDVTRSMVSVSVAHSVTLATDALISVGVELKLAALCKSVWIIQKRVVDGRSKWSISYQKCTRLHNFAYKHFKMFPGVISPGFRIRRGRPPPVPYPPAERPSRPQCLDSDTNFHLVSQSPAFPLFLFYETTTGLESV